MVGEVCGAATATGYWGWRVIDTKCTALIVLLCSFSKEKRSSLDHWRRKQGVSVAILQYRHDTHLNHNYYHCFSLFGFTNGS